jgi:hypothetical protein
MCAVIRFSGQLGTGQVHERESQDWWKQFWRFRAAAFGHSESRRQSSTPVKRKYSSDPFGNRVGDLPISQ